MTGDSSGDWIDPDQIENRAEELGCTVHKLQQAIDSVGCSVAAVKRWLNGRIGDTPKELEYWSGKLGCSAEELKRAMDAVPSFDDAVGGYPVEAVKASLAKNRDPAGEPHDDCGSGQPPPEHPRQAPPKKDDRWRGR